jgi:ornithine cyclodeaminase/alanine dehydrogenase-like protein (mu-crystallin family)
MLILSRQEIYQALQWAEAVEIIAQGFAALSSGKATVPLRGQFEVPGKEGILLLMPGFDGNEGLAVKTVSVFNRNPIFGLPLIYGLVTLFNSNTGQPLALFDGATITAIRTGAASGAATKYLANPEAAVLALFGAGAQAETQLQAIAAVRPLREVRIYSRTPDRTQALIERMLAQTGLNIIMSSSSAEATQGADIIATATTSLTPVFEDASIPAGVHINSVGSYTPQMREIPGETVLRSLLFADSRESCLAEAGDILIPISEGLFDQNHIAAELGEVTGGLHPGRTSSDQITFFKSVGNAIQDVTLAQYLYHKALQLGLGTEVKL